MNRFIKTITGRGIAVRGNDIDTDRIIPARFLRCVTFEGLGAHAFEDDKVDPTHAFNQPQYAGATILVANKNFGCGSSREHAPQALRDWGIAGIVGESFAEIFFSNCTTLGIPCMQVSAHDADAIACAIEANPTVTLTLDVEANQVTVNQTRYPATLPTGPRGQLLDGSWDALGELLDGTAQIRQLEAALLY